MCHAASKPLGPLRTSFKGRRRYSTIALDGGTESNRAKCAFDRACALLGSGGEKRDACVSLSELEIRAWSSRFMRAITEKSGSSGICAGAGGCACEHGRMCAILGITRSAACASAQLESHPSLTCAPACAQAFYTTQIELISTVIGDLK